MSLGGTNSNGRLICKHHLLVVFEANFGRISPNRHSFSSSACISTSSVSQGTCYNMFYAPSWSWSCWPRVASYSVVQSHVLRIFVFIRYRLSPLGGDNSCSLASSHSTARCIVMFSHQCLHYPIKPAYILLFIFFMT